MADIFHRFPVNTTPEKVFELISTAKGLDIWWTKSSTGTPAPGEIYTFFFGPGYDWRAVVSKYVPNTVFELTITHADADWMNTKVGFSLSSNDNSTEVDFYHTGWTEANAHYRTSCFCWAMYLRILKRNLEYYEEVPYEGRLDA